MTKSELSRALDHDPVNLGGRAFPLVFRLLLCGWSGLVVLFFALTFSAGTHSGDAGIVAWVFVGSSVVMVYLSGFLLNRLILELPTRTYIREHGLYPFSKRWQGSLDEFDHLELGRQRFQGSQSGEYFVWCLRLVPKAAVQSAHELPAIVVFGRGGFGSVDRAEILSLAENLARKMGLPLQNAVGDRPTPSTPG